MFEFYTLLKVKITQFPAPPPHFQQGEQLYLPEDVLGGLQGICWSFVPKGSDLH